MDSTRVRTTKVDFKDTKDLRYFRQVYEDKSINQAAKQLFITPQGLSRVITKLEGELQTKLFERTSSHFM